MKYLNLSLPTPEENLACDEALLELCEAGYPNEILRFWESPQYFVVLGYGNKVAAEVYTDICTQANIPILRRPSGGGTVIQGPGCLNYALILNISSRRLKNITLSNQIIMGKIKESLEPIIGPQLQIQGDTDLTIGSLKFSGNAQRRKRAFLLFHGTFLINFDLNIIDRLLKHPKRQPAYRKKRSHKDFLMNLNLSSTIVQDNICDTWNASESFDNIPHQIISNLVEKKYANDKNWNYKF